MPKKASSLIGEGHNAKGGRIHHLTGAEHGVGPMFVDFSVRGQSLSLSQ
jgi:hypothetical protein